MTTVELEQQPALMTGPGVNSTVTSLKGQIADLEARLRRNQQNYHQTCLDFSEELKIARFRVKEAAAEVEASKAEANRLHQEIHDNRNELAVLMPIVEAAEKLVVALPEVELERVEFLLPASVIAALENLYGWLGLLENRARAAA